jgi:hypothetical protein
VRQEGRLARRTAIQDGGTAVKLMGGRNYTKQPLVSENTPGIQKTPSYSSLISSAYAPKEVYLIIFNSDSSTLGFFVRLSYSIFL